MSSSETLSNRTQEAVLSRLSAQHKDNINSAQKRGLLAAGGVALYAAGYAAAPAIASIASYSFAAAALTIIPPVAIFAGSALALIAGAKLIGNVSRALTLHQVKTGVAKEGFISQLRQKAGNAWQRAGKLNNISNIAFFAVIGTAVAASSVALAPLAAAVYPFAMGAMFAAWGASEWNNGVTQGAVPTTKLVYDIQNGDGAIPPAAAPAAQPGKAKKTLSSLLDVFKRKAANNNSPKAPAQAAAPGNKAPKP